MTWVIHYDTEHRLLRVTVQGCVESEPLLRLTTELKDAILQRGAVGVLVDYRNAVSRLEPYEVFERPRILKEVGFPASVKVAVLYQALDENTQFLENVYRNKNFSVRVFADSQAADSWLAQPAL